MAGLPEATGWSPLLAGHLLVKLPFGLAVTALSQRSDL